VEKGNRPVSAEEFGKRKAELMASKRVDEWPEMADPDRIPAAEGSSCI
jgi:hypothetical protein